MEQLRHAVVRPGSRSLVGAVLVASAIVCWVVVVHQSRSMSGQMARMDGTMTETPSMRLGLSSTTYDHAAVLVALLFTGMWVVMMAGMMLPAMTPLVSAYQQVYRQRARLGRPTVSAVVLVAGYLTAWASFGLGAYLVDRGAETWADRTRAVRDAAPLVGGVLLVLAGLYQWTPLKRACLRWCRTPAHFVLVDWREGALGAFRMGMHNGLYCVGCCWAMMVALLVVGVMSLPWMALLAVVIFIEKNSRFAVPAGHTLAALLVISGILFAIHPGVLPGTTL
jgi:predicted metal-binding membrane protein